MWTPEQWVGRGREIFGPNEDDWWYVCPSCGGMASGGQYKARGATVAIGQGGQCTACLGYYTPLARDWLTSGGPGPCTYGVYGQATDLLNFSTATVGGKPRLHYAWPQHPGHEGIWAGAPDPTATHIPGGAVTWFAWGQQWYGYLTGRRTYNYVEVYLPPNSLAWACHAGRDSDFGYVCSMCNRGVTGSRPSDGQCPAAQYGNRVAGWVLEGLLYLPQVVGNPTPRPVAPWRVVAPVAFGRAAKVPVAIHISYRPHKGAGALGSNCGHCGTAFTVAPGPGGVPVARVVDHKPKRCKHCGARHSFAHSTRKPIMPWEAVDLYKGK